MRSDPETLDLLRVYLDQIGRHPLLTREDEIELSQAYEAGTPRASWPPVTPTTPPVPTWRRSPSGVSGPAAG
jgi:hypothetical protein